MTLTIDDLVQTRGDDSDLPMLLHRTGCGDRSAFGELYDRVAPSAYGALVSVLGDSPATDDVLVDVFTEVWQRAPQARVPKSAVRGWVLRLANQHATRVLTGARRAASR